MVLRNRTVEHNVAMFSGISLAIHWQGRPSIGNSANQVMLDNISEKVDECPLNWGCYVLLAYNSECKKCLLYRVVGCPLSRGS